MQYVLLIYDDETVPPDDARMAEYGAFSEDVAKRGLMKGADRLQPTTTATSVRVRNGNRVTTDGPFAETKEQLGGYYILNCKDLDEAIDYAAKIPSARTGTIEVRPIWEM